MRSNDRWGRLIWGVTAGFAMTMCVMLMSGQGAIAAGGSGAGYFISQGAGARALGMGRAFTGTGDDVSSIYWNPAGFVFAEKNELSLTHINLFLDTRYDNLSFGLKPLDNWGIGLGVINMETAGIVKRDINNFPGQEIKDVNNALTIANSFIIPGTGNKLSAGVAFKVINKSFDGLEATGFDADLGLSFRLLNKAPYPAIGISAQNVAGYKLKREYVEEKAGMNIRAGAGIKLFEERLLIGADYEKAGDGSAGIYAGIEAKPLDLFSLRLGYDNGNLTGGLGFSPGAFNLDYAVLNHSFGLSHRATVSIKFGESEYRGGDSSKIKNVIAKLSKQAQDLFENEKYAEAVVKWEKVLKIAPDDEDAAQGIKEARAKIEQKKKEGKTAIAIMDFEAKDPVSPGEASFVTDMFRGEIINSKKYRVVEKKNMEQILAEQGFQQTGCTTQECAIQMGKILSVKMMVLGGFGKLMGKYIITLRMLEVETGEIVYSDDISFYESEDIKMEIKAIANKLIKK